MTQTVVLIDDDVDDLYFISEAIHEMDSTVQCVSFTHPEEAISTLKRPNTSAPNYIFIDINMPKINGFECLNKLRVIDLLSGVKFVMVSTTINDDIKQRLRDNGVKYCFQKPDSLGAYRSMLTTIFAP